MNLVNEPWIPVIMQDKTSRHVSLRDVFTEGEAIADLAANPCQRIALTRLLICIAQAALNGPEDEEDWCECRARVAPAALAYLDTWQDRFNLFGEHAFLQVEGLEPQPNALADKLDFTLACGNNPTLFDHAATPEGRVPQGASLALSILVYQMFSPGGLMGTASWENQTTERKSEHAPCLEGSMLHTLLKGGHLGETVHLNLLTHEQISTLPNTSWGRPYWELDRLLKRGLMDNASSYLGRLLPMPRAVRLMTDGRQIVLSAGILYEKIPVQREPAATVVKVGVGTNERLSYLSVNPAKHPWRELVSILAFQRADQFGGAFCLNHLRTIRSESFDIWTGGLCADKAKLVDMAEWTLTVPSNLLDTQVLERYQRGVKLANDAKNTLFYAIKTYAELLKSEATWRDRGERVYWENLDSQSSILVIAAIQDDSSVSMQWVPIIRQALHDAYSQTCPHETPRQIQAYAQGLKIIESWKENPGHGTRD